MKFADTENRNTVSCGSASKNKKNPNRTAPLSKGFYRFIFMLFLYDIQDICASQINIGKRADASADKKQEEERNI